MTRLDKIRQLLELVNSESTVEKMLNAMPMLRDHVDLNELKKQAIRRWDAAISDEALDAALTFYLSAEGTEYRRVTQEMAATALEDGRHFSMQLMSKIGTINM